MNSIFSWLKTNVISFWLGKHIPSEERGPFLFFILCGYGSAAKYQNVFPFTEEDMFSTIEHWSLPIHYTLSEINDLSLGISLFIVLTLHFFILKDKGWAAFILGLLCAFNAISFANSLIVEGYQHGAVGGLMMSIVGSLGLLVAFPKLVKNIEKKLKRDKAK